jgi:hypothetical protein
LRASGRRARMLAVDLGSRLLMPGLSTMWTARDVQQARARVSRSHCARSNMAFAEAVN